MTASADPSILNSNYVLPPDYDVMTETAEVFTRALLLGMTPETNQNNFAQTEFAEPLPEEFLPYEEAVAYMSKRLPVDKETYYALSDKMRYRAFTVSRLADGDAVRNVQGMITNAMEQGTGMNEFLQMTEGQLADAAGMGKGAGWYYETVYRTNTSTAYNVGRAIGFEEVPPIALELIGIDDDRQTELCHSLTSPPFRRPYDDPVWDTMWPPFHFNCRTTIRAIYDQSEIDDAGGEEKFYSSSNPDYKPAEGFGKYPIEKSDSWWDLTDAMQDRAQAFGLDVEFMSARESLGLNESAAESNRIIDEVEKAARKDAEDVARGMGIEYVDYSDIDSRVANEWNLHIAENFKEFSELKNMVNFVGSTEMQNELIEPRLSIIRIIKAYKENPGKSKTEMISIIEQYRIADFSKLNDPKRIARTFYPDDEILKKFAGIGINPNYGHDTSIFLKSLPEGVVGIKGAVDHEVGHLFDHLLDLHNNTEVQKMLGVSSRTDALIVKEKIANLWAYHRSNPLENGLPYELGSFIINLYRKLYG